jgi:hypothetical protein
MNATFAEERFIVRKKVETAIIENRTNPVPPCTKEEALKFFKKSNMLFGREQEELLLRAMPLISGGFVREKITYYTHEEMLSLAKKLVAEADELALAEGFIYGVTHKNYREYILPFVAYHFFKNFPAHKKIEKEPFSFCCSMCDYWDAPAVSGKENEVYLDFFDAFLDASFLYQAKTYISYSVNYALYCLEEGVKFPKLQATKEDFSALLNAVRLAESIPPMKKAGAYKQVLYKSKLLPLTGDETQEFINVLSYLNILHPKDMVGFAQQYTPQGEQKDASEHKNDYAYPVCHWRGEDGVDYKMVERLFGKLECYQV